MVFEILNIIKWLVYILVAAYIYYVVSKNTTMKLKWGRFFIGVFALSLLTYNQFFTLTEIEDVKRSQSIMSKQSNSIRNNSTLDDYLKENKVEEKDRELELAEEIRKQKLKSEEAIKENK